MCECTNNVSIVRALSVQLSRKTAYKSDALLFITDTFFFLIWQSWHKSKEITFSIHPISTTHKLWRVIRWRSPKLTHTKGQTKTFMLMTHSRWVSYECKIKFSSVCAARPCPWLNHYMSSVCKLASIHSFAQNRAKSIDWYKEHSVLCTVRHTHTHTAAKFFQNFWLQYSKRQWAQWHSLHGGRVWTCTV